MIYLKYETPSRFDVGRIGDRQYFPDFISEANELFAKKYFISGNYPTRDEFKLEKKIKIKEWFPCLTCGGSGRGGYIGKWLECTKCNSKGNIEKKAFYRGWTRELIKYKNAQTEYNMKLTRLKTIFKSLPEIDIALLDEYFDPDGCCGCPQDHWEWIK